MIQKTDVIFRYLTVDEARSMKEYNDFAYFRWDGADWFAFYMYADSYYNAAFQLLEDAKNQRYCDYCQPCQNIDSIIYPICFLYRHFVELTLKWLHPRSCEFAIRKVWKGNLQFLHDCRDVPWRVSTVCLCFGRLPRCAAAVVRQPYSPNV